jgi:hypothetical protein
MSIESPATPVAPSAKAINAITKNVSAQLNMMHLPFRYSVKVGLARFDRHLNGIRWAS